MVANSDLCKDSYFRLNVNRDVDNVQAEQQETKNGAVWDTIHNMNPIVLSTNYHYPMLAEAFESVGGAYCFSFVHASGCMFVCTWVPLKKITGQYFLCSSYLPLWSYVSLKTIYKILVRKEICEQQA